MSSAAPPARATRRTVLKATAFGTVVLGAAGAGLASRKPPLREAPPLKVLTPLEYTQIAAFCEALCPGKAGLFPSATDVGLPALIDAQLDTLEADVREGVRTAIAILDSALVGAVAGERVAPLSTLPLEERTQALEAWRFSNTGFRRTIFRAISGLAQSVYWAIPAVQMGAGYAGPPDRAQLRRTYSENLVDYDALRASKKPTET